MYSVDLSPELDDNPRFSFRLKTFDGKRRFCCTVLELLRLSVSNNLLPSLLDKDFELSNEELLTETDEFEKQFCNLKRCLKYLDLMLYFSSCCKKIEDVPLTGGAVVVPKGLLSVALLAAKSAPVRPTGVSGRSLGGLAKFFVF